MGGKPSNNMQSNRPESGGADKDDQMERSGLLEREKQEFAASEQKKAQDSRPRGEAMDRPEAPGADPAAGTSRDD